MDIIKEAKEESCKIKKINRKLLYKNQYKKKYREEILGISIQRSAMKKKAE